jgi:hypothetical protein
MKKESLNSKKFAKNEISDAQKLLIVAGRIDYTFPVAGGKWRDDYNDRTSYWNEQLQQTMWPKNDVELINQIS